MFVLGLPRLGDGHVNLAVELQAVPSEVGELVHHGDCVGGDLVRGGELLHKEVVELLEDGEELVVGGQLQLTVRQDVVEDLGELVVLVPLAVRQELHVLERVQVQLRSVLHYHLLEAELDLCGIPHPPV